ncbi:type IV pilus modification protein PilV [Psychrobacter sp. A3]|uniref:type IV pilus modification protein PilV n=1 Tax=Psychrobacter sp. A3 TaxID=2992754 RepID=UPI00237B5054|nr:type IV pilus modification protein PilV [Psychrobacter sp. A3]MDE0491472.1 type IV pilus modification protein PilV [Psychrobacter sp. A3]
MRVNNRQSGIGLVEVLVAVLLLSIAVLGFSALQVRAISTTDESLVRTKSLTVVRNLAEVMRAYPEAYVTGSGSSFAKAVASDNNAVPTVQAVVSSNATDSVTIDSQVVSIVGTDSCLSTTTKTIEGKEIAQQSCDINQLAARDALIVKKMAKDQDLSVSIVMCPGTSAQAIQQQMCVITAWSDTKAILDDNDSKACASANGVYKTGSHCLISEAY